MYQSASVLVLELCISLQMSLCWNYVSVCKCPCVGTMYQSASVLLLKFSLRLQFVYSQSGIITIV